VLSPSHPGPDKATHLSMCDRTFIETGLVASTSVSIPVSVFVANSVGVKRCSTATGYRANNCAFLATDRCANQSSGASSCCGGYLVAMPIPNGSIAIPISVRTPAVVTLLVASTIGAAVTRLRPNWNCRHRQHYQNNDTYNSLFHSLLSLRASLLAMSVPIAGSALFCSFAGVELKIRRRTLTITCGSCKVIHLLG